MDNIALPEALAAQDAADALVALGYKVIPHSCASDLWQVEGYILTETELVGFAALQGVQVVSEQVH